MKMQLNHYFIPISTAYIYLHMDLYYTINITAHKKIDNSHYD